MSSGLVQFGWILGICWSTVVAYHYMEPDPEDWNTRTYDFNLRDFQILTERPLAPWEYPT